MATIESYDTDPIIGKPLGTSTILSELARGGMAIVFIAYQRTLKRRIAVKILPKTLMGPNVARLFQQEAEAAAILSHPNIVQIYEVGETEKFFFFTMQLIHGATLTKLINMSQKHPLPSKRILPLNQTIQIVIQLLYALHSALQQDIIHRFINPDIILF